MRLGLIAISVPMLNGSNSFWSCPDIIIGTILRKKRASTRTLLFIFRGSIKFLELITTLRNGRKYMAWMEKQLRLAFLGKLLNRLRKEKERPKNSAHLMERRWASPHLLWLPSPSRNIS